jgi:hypothetical protein
MQAVFTPNKTTMGATIPPRRALTLAQPMAVLRTTVGKSSAVYMYDTVKAADVPKRPAIAKKRCRLPPVAAHAMHLPHGETGESWRSRLGNPLARDRGIAIR